jgi:hypothetical protein
VGLVSGTSTKPLVLSVGRQRTTVLPTCVVIRDLLLWTKGRAAKASGEVCRML